MADADISTRRNHIDRFRLAQSIRVNWSEILSNDVDKFVCEHAAILSCAKELLLCPLLTSVASCMGPNTTIQVSPHWQESPILWTVIAARRGERKTTVFGKVRNENLKLEQEIGALNSVNGDQSTPRRIIDEQNIKLLFNSEQETSRESSATSSVYIIQDDLGSWISRREVETEMKDWDYSVFRRLYDGPECPANNQDNQNNCHRKYINFSANVQALDLPVLFDRADTEGLLERVLVVCAPDWSPSIAKNDESSNNSPSLQSVLSSVRNLHQVQNITYTFSPDGKTELEKCFDEIQSIKERYSDYERCRGSVNFASGHVVRLCAILTALKNGLAMVNRGSFLPPRIIDQDTVRNAYSLVLSVLRQKVALLQEPTEQEHAGNRTTPIQVLAMPDEELESTDSKNVKVTTSCMVNEEMDTKDVIEIEDRDEEYYNEEFIPRTATVSKIDLSNVPSSSIDFQVSDIRSESYVPSSNDIMVFREGYTTSYTSTPPRSHTLVASSGGPVFPDQQMEVGQMSHLISPNISGNASLAASGSGFSQQNFDNQQSSVPVAMPNLNMIARDQKQSNTGASNTGPQTSYRPIPRQIFANKAKLNNKYSSNLYKMPDTEFIFKCCQKIRKLMTSKGRVVTASHACQYRLFPPVPLEQRMSSPRTTHPAWAATKFFEKLESLGLGCLLVFRGQSIKFQKNKLEDMTDEAREILAKIRLSEQDYVDSFTTVTRHPVMTFGAQRGHFGEKKDA